MASIRRRGPASLPLLFVASVGAAFGSGGACSFDWQAYDPRLTSSSAGGPGGAGGGVGEGGASSSGVGGSGGAGGVSASSAGGAGSGGGEGGGGPTKCGGTDVLTDDFSDGDSGVQWWWTNDPGMTVSETNGEAVITLPINNPSSGYAALQTKRLYDLRSDSVSVEVKQTADPATTAVTFLVVNYDDDNYLEIAQQQGKLTCARIVGGVNVLVASISYDAQAHRFWRVRDDGAATYFETSADGASWVIRGQTPTAQLFPLAAVRVDVGVFLHGGEVNPGQARFDNVNGGGAPAGKWCPTSTFTDNFNDGVTSRAWRRSYFGVGQTCTYAEAGGHMVLKLASNVADSYCAYWSSSSYDMTGDAVTIEAPVMVNTATNADAFLRIEVEDEAFLQEGALEIGQTGGTLELRRSKNGISDLLGAVPYSLAEHRWWRIREASGTTYFEYSADGVAWTIGAMDSPSSLPLTAVDILIVGGTYEAIAAPGEAHFDNLNGRP